jgi:hypothetical protein
MRDTHLRDLEIVDRGAGWLTWRQAGAGLLECCSHALRDDDGSVWVIDPIDCNGLDDTLAEFGDVAGVLVLVDRHLRDAPALARRHRARLFIPAGEWRTKTPPDAFRYDTHIEDCPFEFHVLQQRDRQWIERALWWPRRRLLVVPEALGNARYFLSRSQEALAVHPLLRFGLGAPKRLHKLDPQTILVGHGAPVTDNASSALHHSLGTSKSGIPNYLAASPGHLIRIARAMIGAGRASC